MIWLFVLCLGLLVLLLQREMAWQTLGWLRCSAKCEQVTAEVGETVTFITRVENHGPLPILYVRIREHLPPQADVREDAAWMERHLKKGMWDRCVEDVCCLLPRQRRTTGLRAAFPCRGWYRMEGVELATGDLLGFETASRRVPSAGEVVVLPPRCREQEALRTLGGFLGDISVRRFILEDPVLTTGFREYTGREPMKAISWTQSARAGRMVVKQYDYTVELSVTVLLNAEGGSDRQLERCLSLCRTACEMLEEGGIPYDLRTNIDLMGPVGLMDRVDRGLGRQHLQTILYGLGRSVCRCTRPLEAVVERCLGTARPNQSYLVITPPLSAGQDAPLQRLRAMCAAVTVLTGEEEGL